MRRDLQEDVCWYWSAMEKPSFDELNSLVVMQNGLVPATIIYRTYSACCKAAFILIMQSEECLRLEKDSSHLFMLAAWV